MTTEEKAKAYDEALERAKNLIKMYPQDAPGYKEIFPELRESEDERVKNEIIECIETLMKQPGASPRLCDWLAWLEKQKALSELGKYIADKRSKVGFYCNHKEVSWNEIPLEDRKHDYPYYFDGDIDCYPFVVRKQKEQKTLELVVKEITKDKDSARTFLRDAGIIDENGELAEIYRSEQKVTENSNDDIIIGQIAAIINLRPIANKKELLSWLEKQKEQKSAEILNLRTWEKVVDMVLTEHNGIGQYLDDPDTERIAKKLKERFSLPNSKPVEWSEEDEKYLDYIIKYITHYDFNQDEMGTLEEYHKLHNGAITWLKSLRPQKNEDLPKWKPSEEQMKGLKFFLDFHRSQRNAGTTNWREYDAVESLYEQLKKLI